MMDLNKLVRDKVPALVTKDGGSYTMQLLSPEVHQLEVKNKLLEETKEYIASTSKDFAIDELVDIVELVYTALNLHEVSIEEFEALRVQKRKLKGGFDHGIFLTEISK